MDQLEQAQRVLQHGYRWNQYLKGHRDVRDFITDLAKETLHIAGNTSAQPIWCDPCSAGLAAREQKGLPSTVIDAYTNEEDKQAYAEPETYYSKEKHPALWAQIRLHLERASGVTIAYLVSRNHAGGVVCEPTGQDCGLAGQRCCGGSGSVCSRDGRVETCCRAREAACLSDSA